MKKSTEINEEKFEEMRNILFYIRKIYPLLIPATVHYRGKSELITPIAGFVRGSGFNAENINCYTKRYISDGQSASRYVTKFIVGLITEQEDNRSSIEQVLLGPLPHIIIGILELEYAKSSTKPNKLIIKAFGQKHYDSISKHLKRNKVVSNTKIINVFTPIERQIYPH